jgi:hypothetical protein
MGKPQSAPVIKSWVKHSIPSIQNTMFALRELIRTPKEQWTPAQRKWWASVNIVLGSLESDLAHEQRKNKK